jgi:hypothetical protein
MQTFVVGGVWQIRTLCVWERLVPAFSGIYFAFVSPTVPLNRARVAAYLISFHFRLLTLAMLFFSVLTRQVTLDLTFHHNCYVRPRNVVFLYHQT